MQKLTILSLVVSTSMALGMQTPQPIVYKTDQVEFIQHTHENRTLFFLAFTHEEKKYDMLKIVNHSTDNPSISIDRGNTPLTQEECAQKFAHIEEQAKQARLNTLQK